VALRYRHALASGRVVVVTGKIAHLPSLESPPTPKLARRVDSDAAKLIRLEAVLFLAKEPLSSRKLSQHANLADGTEARTLVGQLNRRLDESSRAFYVRQVAGGFQLMTRAKFAKWLRRLPHVPGELRLSAPSLETLAVIAYRQPVMRAHIEAVRGVGCGEILAQLLGRDMIRVSGRSDDLGRPYLYNTTKRFLQLFGLRSLDELPRAEFWRNATHDSPETMGESAETEGSEDRKELVEEE
jgi:segregation and condensation protein B